MQAALHECAVVRLLGGGIDALNSIQACAYIDNAMEGVANAGSARAQKYRMLQDAIAQIAAPGKDTDRLTA